MRFSKGQEMRGTGARLASSDEWAGKREKYLIATIVAVILVFAIAQRAVCSAKLIQWRKDGEPVSIGEQKQEDPVILPDGYGGAIIAWSNDIPVGEHDGDHLYGQRINSEGELKWGSDGVVVCDQGLGQRAVSMITNGSGVAILAWEDSGGGQGLANPDISDNPVIAERAVYFNNRECGHDSIGHQGVSR